MAGQLTSVDIKSECRERKRERSAALEQQVGEMGAQLRQLAALRHELASLAAANE